MHPWREVQRKNFTRLSTLLDFLKVADSSRSRISIRPSFPLNVPLRLAEKIEKNNLDDPLFRQFVPLIEEETLIADFTLDPVGDCNARKHSQLLKKYAGRALLITTSACAMHCRYCFRQHFDYVSAKDFEEALFRINQDKSLFEIILSGGDPLSLSDETLKVLLQKLSSIEHIRIIRFHSRFPIGIPERIDDSFLDLLSHVRPQIIFVTHINHPRELDEEVIASLKKIQRLGIPILNQSVLLRGVNDNAPTLIELSKSLIQVGIMPYYLHQLDRVQGAAHFEVAEREGLNLIEALTQVLPGYGVPKYVREIAGEKSKQLVGNVCR